MARRLGWFVLAAGLGGCPGGVFFDGFVGDTAAGPIGGGDSECVVPLLGLGPTVPIDPSGEAWVRLAPGITPEVQLDGPTGSFRPAITTRTRVAADGSTITFFRPEAGFEAGSWSMWITWPIELTVLDPETLEVQSSTRFCSAEVTAPFQVEAAATGHDANVTTGTWWLRQGEETPDGRLLTRVLDAGRTPAGRALALDVGSESVALGTRLRAVGVPVDACDPSDPLQIADTESGVRWQAASVRLEGAEGGAVELLDLTLDLNHGFDPARQRIQLSTIVDLREADEALRARACDTWAPEAGLACGACPDDASATSCLALAAPDLLLERPPVAAEDSPAACP